MSLVIVSVIWGHKQQIAPNNSIQQQIGVKTNFSGGVITRTESVREEFGFLTCTCPKKFFCSNNISRLKIIEFL